MVAFHDGLGERRLSKDSAGAVVEALCLRRELAAVPSFEFGVRERFSRLGSFRHAYYGRVRAVERSSEFDQALTITSDQTAGIRLSTLLDASHERRLPVDIDVALCLIRQLVPAVAILHETARDAAHGALGPERLVVTPNGRLVIVEYVLGSALEQLLFSRERYWTELRIALPRVAGLPRFDHLADVTQIGVTALSLILGRTLRDDEYPARIGDVLSAATAVSARGNAEPLPPGLRGWLNRALQLDSRHSFPSAIEARVEFEKVLAESGCVASPEKLDAFLARHHEPDRPVAAIALPSEKSTSPTTLTPGTDVKPQPHAVLASVVPDLKPPPHVTPSPVIPDEKLQPHVTPTPMWPDVKQQSPSASAFLLDPKSPTPAQNPPGATFDVKVPSHVTPPVRAPRSRFVKMAAAAVMFLVLAAGGALVGARRFLADDPAPTATGTLLVTTNPAGAEAIVDGVRRGKTPLTLTLIAGSHKVELRGQGEPRVIPVTIAPGLQMAQYVDLPNIAAALPIEAHAEAAQTSAAPAAPSSAVEPSPSPGWIAVAGPVQVQLYEGGRLLGSSEIDRIMVPAGRHELEVVNEVLGYRATRSIQVSPGRVATLTIDSPKTTISINALPWAEVWMDGTKIGETPIGNLVVSAGSHDFVFRHPDFGERRETVLATLSSPVRLSVDMRKP